MRLVFKHVIKFNFVDMTIATAQNSGRKMGLFLLGDFLFHNNKKEVNYAFGLTSKNPAFMAEPLKYTITTVDVSGINMYKNFSYEGHGNVFQFSFFRLVYNV